MAVATALRLVLHPLLGPNLQFLTYFAAVFATAAVGGLGPTALAVVLSAILAEYLFFLPMADFGLHDPVAMTGLAVFSLLGLGIGWLGETRLRALARARAEATESRRLEQAAEAAAIEAEESAAQAEEETLRAEEEASRAQRALESARAADERTRAILESTTDAYIAVDRAWRITYANGEAAAVLRALGVDTGALVGRTLWETWPDSIGTELERQYRRVMLERVPAGLEHWYPAEQRWLDTHAYPVVEGGLAIFFRDITARKQAEQSLREAETTYRALAELSPEAILVIRNERYVYANQAAARVLGVHGPEQILGRTPFDFLEPEYHNLVRERLQRVRHEGAHVPVIQYRWRRADGTPIEVEVTKGPVAWRGEAAIQVVARDVTDRNRTAERLEQITRMDAVGRLAGGVAHEVNNQMTVVLGSAAFLLRRPDLPEGIRTDLEQIEQAAERSAAITRQLLAFGRRQLLRLAAVDLNRVVTDTEAILKRALGTGIHLELALEPDLAPAFADQGQVTQALLNLVLNARDAIAGEGTVRIHTSTVAVPAGNTLDGGTEAPAGTYVTLRVADTGIGMDASTQRRIFEPFFTTKPVGKGTGLGLAMVYGMARQSRGFVTVTSTLGRGSTFTLHLPRADGPAPVQSPSTGSVADHPVPPRNDKGPRYALVAEDEPSVRALAARVLREDGFEVLEASDGGEALALFHQLAPEGRLDLVVSDLAMPRMGGHELAQRLRVGGYGGRLLFISGYPDEDMQRLGLATDGHELLRKPFSPEALRDRVRRLVSAAGDMRG